MTAATLTSYEQIPYQSAPIQATHPDNLASLATLFGLRPPLLETGRVLELGCATGGNLIAIADSLPNARCVGIDLSPSHIAAGRELAQSLGLNNVELSAGSILDVTADWGQFDYIICHGVYSWVPSEVQDHILTVCSRNLAPTGVAYISYNVYPGWHIGRMIRDMVNFHGRRFPDPRERVAQVRQFLDFLTRLVECDPDNTLYYQILAKQVEDLREAGDSYLFHEYLEEVNQPVYFHEFAQTAAGKGLQFVSEAQLSAMTGNLPPDVKEALHGWSDDIVQYEQYLDFVRNRRFRKTLLCHADATLCRTPAPGVVRRFHFTGHARPMAETADPSPDGVEQFRTPTGVTFSTNNPWLRAAVRTLFAVFPRSLTFAELAARAATALPAAVAPDEERLEQALFQCVLGGLVELHLHTPAFVTEVGERPVASPLARLQATHERWVTNRRHRNVEIEGLDRALLPAVDGSRDRAAFVEILTERVRGGMTLHDENDREVHEPARARELLVHGVDMALRRFARSALLVG